MSQSAATREPLRDAHGRTITDLRVSVTDRCNFRCRYCMPAEGMPWLAREEVLSFEEIERLVRILTGLGIEDVRLTGGEPLARREFPTLVSMLRSIDGHPRPLGDDQRLPARARRGGARRRRDRPHQRLDRLARPRPLPRDHPPRRAAPGAARARGDRGVRARAADQGQRGRDPRLHRERGDRVRRDGALDRLPGPLHRVHAARRRSQLGAGHGSHRRRDPGADRRSATRSSRCPASPTRPPASSASPTAPARSASSTRSRSRSAPTATGSA